MLSPSYPLVTERLLLRPLDPTTDVESLVAYHSLPDNVRYVPFEARSRDDVLAVFERGWYRSTADEPRQGITLGVVRRDSGQLIGDVLLLWTSDVHRSAEMGYMMHPDHQGKGFATEACRALLRLAFVDFRLHRVTARLDERNRTSARVLERLGMRAEARLVENQWFKGEWATELDYAILAREWADSQP